MKTTGNEFFYYVSGLMVPKETVDERIIDYIELFIDQAPILTDQIKQYLNDTKTVAFIMGVKNISSMLHKIYANRLMIEANRIIRLAETDNLTICRKKITPFIADLLSLSIDLQISQKNSGALEKKNIIELYTDALNNLNAIDTLIADEEYEKAANILSHIELLRENDNARRLSRLIEDGDYKNAVTAAEELKDEYSELLNDLGVTFGNDAAKKKILAVDDHSDILITVRGMLEPHFNVYAAAGGKTALAIMERHDPDLFLLDIEMPEISGFELAKTIRAISRHKTTPIIFLTSNATRECVMEALKCGADDFIVKPASYNALMIKISKLIKISKD